MSQADKRNCTDPSPLQEKVVTLVDWDNFFSNCASRGMEVRPAVLKTLSREVGRPIWSSVFVDARTLQDSDRLELFRHGFDIVDCPRLGSGRGTTGKDLVDAKIIERMHIMAEHMVFDALLLASHDRDFLLEVQFIRDTGRQVLIVVPTANDRPEISGLADGNIVYDKYFDGVDSPLSQATQLFERRDFQTRDVSVLRELARLREIVDVLIKDFDINDNRLVFHALRRKVEYGLSNRGIDIDSNGVRRLVSFLVSHGVLVRTPIMTDNEQAVRGDRSPKQGPVCYRVQEDHPFVRLHLNALKEAAGLRPL